MTPPQAYDAYVVAEKLACETYMDYWLGVFSQAGIKFNPSVVAGYFEGGVFDGYKLEARVNPARYKGIRIKVIAPSQPPFTYPHWSWVTVKSESGLITFF